jgi:serine/threonine protein phosphatase 1
VTVRAIRLEAARGDIYVIGDIHGEVEALAALVESLPLRREDTIIQLGDCINRGPQSFEVVEYWLRVDRCQRYVLRGNHEEMFLSYLRQGCPAMLAFGGEATLQSYQRHGWRALPGVPHSIPEAHLRFYGLAYPWTGALLVTPGFLFVHAGYDMAHPPDAQQDEMLTWGSVYRWRQSRTPQTIVRGHVPYPAVMIGPEGWIGVDTGCGLGGELSCLRLPDRQVFTARPASYRPRWWKPGS